MREMPAKYGAPMAEGAHEHQADKASTAAAMKAWMPWLILSVFVFAWGTPQVKTWLDSIWVARLPVEGLHNLVQKVPPVVAKPAVEGAVYVLNLLSAAGTGILLAAIVSGLLIGWLGVALTGSDTSSNVLFGGLQKISAEQLGLSPVLMAAANSSGGVMGKMIDAQSIVVASTATKWY